MKQKCASTVSTTMTTNIASTRVLLSGQEGADDCVDRLGDVDDYARFVRRQRLQRVELRLHQRCRHEVTFSGGLTGSDHLGRAVQVQKDRGRTVRAQLVTICAFERRATDHTAVAVA